MEYGMGCSVNYGQDHYLKLVELSKNSKQTDITKDSVPMIATGSGFIPFPIHSVIGSISKQEIPRKPVLFTIDYRVFHHGDVCC